MRLKLLSLCLLLTGALSAQNSASDQSAFFKKAVQQLLERNSRALTGKKAPYPQLIAQSEYSDDGGIYLSDTAEYYYSLHSQGAKFDFNVMSYGNFDYMPADQPLVDLDFNGDSWRAAPNIVCDSSLQKWYTSFDSTINKVKYTYSGERLTNYESFEYYTGGSFYGERHKLAYNTGNQMVGVLKEATEDNIDWDTLLIKVISYDGMNRMASDTFLDFDAGVPLATEYHYDGSGNITEIHILGDVGSGWMEVATLTLTYDGSNRLRTAESASLFNPDVIGRDSFGYTGNSKFYTYWHSAEYENGNPTWEQLVTKHLNAQSLPDSVYGLSENDVWVFSYNTDGHPTGYVVYDTTGGTYTATNWIHYYYNNSLSAPKQLEANGQITLYPNPATNQLNLSWADFTAGTTGVEIINTTGQVVLRDELSWQQSNQSLSIASLQPGVYWVTLTDAQGNAIFRQAVVKQ